jgi:hypothetical protein
VLENPHSAVAPLAVGAGSDSEDAYQATVRRYFRNTNGCQRRLHIFLKANSFPEKLNCTNAECVGDQFASPSQHEECTRWGGGGDHNCHSQPCLCLCRIVVQQGEEPQRTPRNWRRCSSSESWRRYEQLLVALWGCLTARLLPHRGR